MNMTLNTSVLRAGLLSGFFMLITFISLAQDSTTTSTATTSSNSTSSSSQAAWYMNPIAWVVGGVIVLILLIALIRSGSSATDRVTVTKTVTRDTDV